MLTIIPTPIGNLKDITLRALELLKESDEIVCEDSRRSLLLLNHYNIKKPLTVLNDFNEPRVMPLLIQKLKGDKKICLISDAGTPLISDPGYKLVRECLKENILVDSLPGPSSVITALTLSGLPPDKFIFLGFLPDKPGHRQKVYLDILSISKVSSLTYIIFISPYKILKTLTEMKEQLGNIPVTLAKELTKIHQKVDSKPLSIWLEEFSKIKPKGEWILLFNL